MGIRSATSVIIKKNSRKGSMPVAGISLTRELTLLPEPGSALAKGMRAMPIGNVGSYAKMEKRFLRKIRNAGADLERREFLKDEFMTILEDADGTIDGNSYTVLLDCVDMGESFQYGFWLMKPGYVTDGNFFPSVRYGVSLESDPVGGADGLTFQVHGRASCKDSELEEMLRLFERWIKS